MMGRLIKNLKNANVTEYHRNEFNNIIDFIKAGTSLDGEDLRNNVKLIDWRRQQDLRTHHLELANAIDYKGPSI